MWILLSTWYIHLPQYAQLMLDQYYWTFISQTQLLTYAILVMFLGYGKDIPKFCLSANISKSDNRNYLLNKHRQNCSSTLEWFVCKNCTVILLIHITIKSTWKFLLYHEIHFAFGIEIVGTWCKRYQTGPYKL